MLFDQNLRAAVESLLFITNEPLTVKQIAELVEVSQVDALELLKDLKAEYNQEIHGIVILEVAGGYIMATKSSHKSIIEKLYKPQLTNLSAAAVETLAIIAYKQPITRGEIEFIRGVKVEKIIHTLLSKELIEELGRKDAPGRPILYGTTKRFLQYFGICDLSDLPQKEFFHITEESLQQLTDGGMYENVRLE